jgi:hypothetical protein
MTLVLVVAIWIAVSLPVSLALGLLMRGEPEPELVGIEGDHAVYSLGGKALLRVPLLERESV